MERTTITHSKTGQQETIPVKFTKGKTQKALDTLVLDTHNAHPVSAAVVRAMGLEAI